MEPVSFALGVIPVAISLGKGINKLYELLHSIRGASSELKLILDEVEQLRGLLQAIQFEHEGHTSHPALVTALLRFEVSLDALCSMAEKVVSGLSSNGNIKRKWSAVEVVWKSERIAELKSRLDEAKTNILMAQQFSTTRNLNLGLRTNETSFALVLSRLEDIHNSLACQKHVVSYSGKDMHDTRRSNIQDGSDSSMLVQTREGTSTELRIFQIECKSVKSLAGSRLKRNLTTEPRSSIARTLLGKFQFSISTYRVSHTWDDGDDSGYGNRLSDSYQTENTTKFMPAWWLVKLGMARAIEVISTSTPLGTQEWRYGLRTFNLVPSSSLIFESCRAGDIDAVREILISRRGSINDISEYGETPLHIAASRSHPNLCAFLLWIGADTKVRDLTGFHSTPFGRACAPGDCKETRGRTARLIVQVAQPQFENTIREFLKSGEDLEDAAEDRSLHDMMTYESAKSITHLGARRTSAWLLNDVIPAIQPLITRSDVWGRCLFSALCDDHGNPFFRAMITHCNKDTAQSTLLSLISYLESDNDIPVITQTYLRLLIDKAGGLHFIVQSSGRSLIFLIINSPTPFRKFRSILEALSYDVQALVRNEIKICDHGWTEKTLLTMWLEIVPDEKVQHKSKSCKECGYYRKSPFDESIRVSWRRKLRRYKAEKPQNAPLEDIDLEEIQIMEDAGRAFEMGICWYCHGYDGALHTPIY